MPIRTGMAQGVIDALTSMGLSTGLTGVNWLLNWGGVNQYAVHSPWASSGHGDKIEFSFVADNPGTANQYLFMSPTGNPYFNILANASLYYRYIDADGTTVRTITGPTIVAGVLYVGHILMKGDGVDLVVNGTTYSTVNPQLLTTDLTHIAAHAPESEYFNGTINYLRYINATPLQAVNAVQGNGVDLYGVIPEITLTGDFEIEAVWRRQDRLGASQTHLIGDANSLCRVQVYDTGHASLADGLDFIAPAGSSKNFTTALSNIELGQDVAIRLVADGTSLLLYLDDVFIDNPGRHDEALVFNRLYNGHSSGVPLSVGSYLHGVKITDKSGAEDIVYGPYDLSGDNGDVIENTDPVTGMLGDELVTNGGFDTDSDWPHTGTQIAGSALSLADGESTGYTSQDIGLVVGKAYICEFVISGRTIGDVDIGLGGYSEGLNQTASGSFIQTVSGSSIILIRFQNSFDGVLESVAVKEYPHGTWQNYDQGTDQVALPQLSRNYRMNDGPDATELVDSYGDGSTNATLYNVDPADWSK